MKAQKLTPKQKEVFELLNKYQNGMLRRHVKPTGLVCWRLLDDKASPVMNVSESIVYNLKDKDVIEMEGQNYVLKASIGNDNTVKSLAQA